MTPKANIIRVFIALDISQEARQVLSATMLQLQSDLPTGIKWVDLAGIHLTLKFLGNIDIKRVEPVFEAMRQSAQETSPFALKLSNLGMFPNARNPRVLWAGVDGALDALEQLQKKVDQLVSALGFPPEKQGFNPHLTLGRVRESVSSAIRSQIGTIMNSSTLQASGQEMPLWIADEVHLIRSTITSEGAVYTSMGSVPLA